MILCHLYRLIRFAISLLLPADKPKHEWTIDDVKAALAEKAKGAMYKDLDWNTSIVDLCRLLDLDPKFVARNEMYVKAGGSGPYHGSEEQNVWLHSKVMENLAKQGFGE